MEDNLRSHVWHVGAYADSLASDYRGEMGRLLLGDIANTCSDIALGNSDTGTAWHRMTLLSQRIERASEHSETSAKAAAKLIGPALVSAEHALASAVIDAA